MPDVQPTIEKVNGFKVAGVHCGLKKDGKLDFALIVSDIPCTAAGVFTTNYVKAAPVLVDMERLKHHAHHVRAVAINTASANACTGQQGIDNALQTARWVAEEIGCAEDEVLVMSTGVIGTQLPMDKIKHGVQLAADSLGDNWEAAARAIMTTDTKPKMISFKSSFMDYTIAGIAKGAGMIAPNMATMLSVIVTDGLVSTPDVADDWLKSAVRQSFNSIVVDGDTSTNDTVLFLANGATGENIVGLPNDGYEYTPEHWLNYVSERLAMNIVRDAEGATKLISINVTGDLRDEDAHKIANTIATSPLVKTAFYGGDANWGRIMMAAGRAGVPIDMNRLNLTIYPSPTHEENPSHSFPNSEALMKYLNGVDLVVNGEPTDYDEQLATMIMQERSIVVKLRYGNGKGSATVWTCDLSHDYVSINGDYRS